MSTFVQTKNYGMNIALIGYGKMGKAIEQIALKKGHKIPVKISSENVHSFSSKLLKDNNIDVAIEFSTPSTVVKNIHTCFNAHIPVVVGTTAWQAEESIIKKRAMEERQSIFSASNFSVGMNITFRLNKLLSRMMNNISDYSVSIEEVHHTQKLDKPSGTAITLAEGNIQELENIEEWKLEETGERILPITAIREEGVPGTHTVKFECDIDKIEITHTAHNREGFALGAIHAAEWIVGKTGYFGMNDLLNLND